MHVEARNGLVSRMYRLSGYEVGLGRSTFHSLPFWVATFTSSKSKMAETDTTGTAPSGAATSNPLSRKLNKILETRLENDKVHKDFIYV